MKYQAAASLTQNPAAVDEIILETKREKTQKINFVQTYTAQHQTTNEHLLILIFETVSDIFLIPTIR